MNPLLWRLLRRFLVPSLMLMADEQAPAAAPATPAPAAAAPPADPAASTAPAAAAPAAPATPPAAPEKYELKLGENTPLDQSDVDKVAAYARERGLSNEQAQAILDQRHEAATGVTQRQQDMLAAARTKWANDTKGDPEIGGTNFDGTLANVKLVMDKFAPEGSGFRSLLDASGYGNHPEFVRFVNAIGKAMREDKPVTQGAGTGGQRTHADVLYGAGQS
jgi:hypothetical protein